MAYKPKNVRIRVSSNIPEVKRTLDRRLNELLDEAAATGEKTARRILKPGHGVDTGDMENRLTHDSPHGSGGISEASIYLRDGGDDTLKDLANEFGSTEMGPNTFLRPAAASAMRSLTSRARKIGRGL